MTRSDYPKVYCPHCGEQAKLIFCVTREAHVPVWTCTCPADWGTKDPTPYMSRPKIADKQFSLFDLYDYDER